MELSIKNYKACRGNEGDAFSLTLHLDGKKAASVEYDGSGGPYNWRWIDRSLQEAFKRYVAERNPEPDTYGCHADILLEEEIEAIRLRKTFARRCKKETLFRLPDDKPGVWRRIPAPFDESIRVSLLAKHPKALIANADLDAAARFALQESQEGR